MNDEVDLQSASMLLASVKGEYAIENEKNRDFNVRAGILMPLYSAVLIFLITSIISSGITCEKITVTFGWLIYGGYAVCMVLSIVLILYAMYFLLRSFSVSKYQRINFQELPEEVSMFSAGYAMLLYYLYENALRFNRQVNEDKVVHLQRSMEVMKYVVVPLIIGYVLMFIIRCEERGLI